MAVLGGPSGTGLDQPRAARSELAADARARPTSSASARRSAAPVLADWYRAADLVACPRYSESFGLVAVEAQACGTPVVAARVGGLRTAVPDGVTGLLVDGHDPVDWADALGGLLDDRAPRRTRCGRRACGTPGGSAGTPPSTRPLEVYAGGARRTGSPGARGRSASRPPVPLAGRRPGGGAVTARRRAGAEAVVRAWLGGLRRGVEHEPGARPGEFVVQLPGEAKLRTDGRRCWSATRR